MSLLEARTGADLTGFTAEPTPTQIEAILLREKGLQWTHPERDWDEVSCRLGDISCRIVGETHEGGENIILYQPSPNAAFQPSVEGPIPGRRFAVKSLIHTLFEVQAGRATLPIAS